VGKSFIACALGNQAARSGASVRYPVFRNSWPGVRENGGFLRCGTAKVGTTGRLVMLKWESPPR
jgi:hypothetical protein